MKIPYQIRTKEAYLEMYDLSCREPEHFWAVIADHFHWRRKWDRVLEWDFKKAQTRWFEGAELNITENILDRHTEEMPNEKALIWEPNEPGQASKTYTWSQLSHEVGRYANVLKKHGIQKGDRVALYMPMIPDLAISVLACARIGAVHSVVFGGFSSEALAGRIQDAGAVCVITSDGMYRGNKELPVKRIVDEALEQCPTVKTVLVAKRTNWEVNMKSGRDHWLEQEREKVSSVCAAEVMKSEDPLFILYTSGSTGKPKGVVHTCGGYMVYAAYTFANVFQYEKGDLFWCTADIGWITGHSYMVYGPLLNGATILMYEGVPTHPSPARFWQVIDKYGVNQFYTAPTAIRALMALGDDHVLPYSLNSLKVLGTVGEPINEEAWNWYHVMVGREKCPIVDTWWQTETGGIMISGMGGLLGQKAAHAGWPMPGVQAVLVDAEGNEMEENEKEGLLCIKFPWPGMIRTTYGDHERCRTTYFAPYPGYYFTGDGAKRDAEGRYRIIGRVDDVINVSGHRFGTAEIENAINMHPHIAESAVVGFDHEIKGQGIYAYVVCREEGIEPSLLHAEVHKEVVKHIGPIAKPDKIQIVPGLPKTRSGKIMRRILRKIANGDVSNLGDVSTLLDPEVVGLIADGAIMD